MRHLLLASCLLLALGNTLSAQQVAWTTCRGSVVASFVNTDVLGTDSTEEILTHEAKHRAQAQAFIDALGACPWLDPGQRLQIEAEAYCASDSVRQRVKRTPVFETKAISLWRLLSEFHTYISADSVLSVWKATCP